MKEAVPAISLHKLPAARPVATLSGKDYVPPSSYCMVSHGGIRGSCACFYDREDVTSAVLEEQLQLQQVEERCGLGVGWGSGPVWIRC